MQNLIYQWIDLLWLPVGLVVSHRGQRIKTAIFIITCVLTLRTQMELMASIGHPDGILGWWGMGLYERGLILYGAIIMAFLILVYFSPGTRGIIFLAAMLSIYILGFCITMLGMLL